MTNVGILHCGGEEEVHFIQYLEKSLATSKSYTLEYTKFQERQSKETIMYNDAQRYKKERLPIIVLISKYFFELIWLTSYKQALLNIITNYSSKNCLHIWMDVTEEHVKYRSNALLRTDGYFRRIKVPELTTKLSTKDMITTIQGLLNASGDGKFDPLNNYAVDDEELEMRMNFERLTGLQSRTDTNSTPVEQHRNMSTSRNKKDIYKQALRMANMTPEEIEALHRESAGSSECNAQHTNISKKKKNKSKKKADTDTIKLLTDVSQNDKKQIATYLDKGSGANWKQLAEQFGLGTGDIRGLSDCHPQASQTEKLIDMLEVYRPDLEIYEFMQKCKLILRNDVPAYILNNVLK